MLQNLEDFIGFMLLFILLLLKMEQMVIYLVEEKLQEMK